MKFPWFRRVRPDRRPRPAKMYVYPWFHRSPLVLPILMGKFILIGVVFALVQLVLASGYLLILQAIL